MFLFIYGEDSFRSLQKLQEIVDYYRKIHKTGLNLKYYECLDTDFKQFAQDVQSVSMFKEKKLLILKNAFSSPEFKTGLLPFLKEIKNIENIILIYEKDKVDEKNSLFKYLKKEAKTQEFKALTNKKLEDWTIKEFGRYKIGVAPKVRALLVDFVGSNLWQLSQEIKKLINYRRKPAQRVDKEPSVISSEDVELLVIPKIETDIFKTIDAIAAKNRKEAIFLINKHLRKGDSPLYLFSMINFQFRNLLLVKDFTEKNPNYYGFPKIAGLHPYVVRKSLFQSKKFNFDTLKEIYTKLFNIDQGIKTGSLSAEMALDMFITEA